MLRALKSQEDPLEGEYISVDGHVAVDQQPFVKAIVNGSKQVFRDPREGAEAILDPNGDKAYAREMAKGGGEAFEYCACSTHKGARWLPVTQFSLHSGIPSGRQRWCRVCRSDAEHERRVKEAARRGICLQDRPGRPKKRRK